MANTTVLIVLQVHSKKSMLKLYRQAKHRFFLLDICDTDNAHLDDCINKCLVYDGNSLSLLKVGDISHMSKWHKDISKWLHSCKMYDSITVQSSEHSVTLTNDERTEVVDTKSV